METGKIALENGIDSIVGAGTIVRLLLPAGAPIAAAATTAVEPGTASPPPIAASVRHSILLVDDDRQVRRFMALSLREGGPRKFTDWQASFVDGAGGQSVTERMWQRMQPIVDGAITVTLDETRAAMRLIAEKTRTIAEGAGALALAAALTGRAGDGPIVCIVSGGNIDLKTFAELVA